MIQLSTKVYCYLYLSNFCIIHFPSQILLFHVSEKQGRAQEKGSTALPIKPKDFLCHSELKMCLEKMEVCAFSCSDSKESEII